MIRGLSYNGVDLLSLLFLLVGTEMLATLSDRCLEEKLQKLNH